MVNAIAGVKAVFANVITHDPLRSNFEVKWRGPTVTPLPQEVCPSGIVSLRVPKYDLLPSAARRTWPFTAMFTKKLGPSASGASLQDIQAPGIRPTSPKVEHGANHRPPPTTNSSPAAASAVPPTEESRGTWMSVQVRPAG